MSKTTRWAMITLTALGMVATIPTMVSAAPMTFEFCGFSGASSSCAGLSSAKLTFEQVDPALGDPNTYLATASFTGSATNAHPYLDFFSFAFAGVATPGGYEGVPAMTSTPGGATYAFVFDNVSNGGTPCVMNTNQSQEVCANGPSAVALGNGGTATFKFTVNFADAANPANNFLITSTSSVNLRALFVDANGDKDGAILSPNGNYENSGGGGGFDPVPEPASMLLLGTGLLGLGAASRRRTANK